MKRILLQVAIALAVGSAAAMTVEEAKAFMTKSRSRFLSAASYHIDYTTTAKGVPTESRCWIRRDPQKGVSILNESQVMPFGFPMPKITQLATGGKVYLISALAPQKALHLTFADGTIHSDVFCEFFTDRGTVKPLSDGAGKCVIQFTPSAAELLQMGEQAISAAGPMSLANGFVPAAFRYTFLKPSGDISEIACLDKQGQAIVTVVVSKLELNAQVSDSYFALPKGCKVIDLKSAAELANSLGDLLPGAFGKQPAAKTE